MKEIYIAISDSLMQMAVSEALFYEVAGKDGNEPPDMEAIGPLLSKMCTYALAIFDFEESSSPQSKCIIDGIKTKDIVVAIAGLWRYNAGLGGDGDALLVVDFDEDHKRKIREARGLVKHFSLNRFKGQIEPHKKVVYDLPWSALN